MKAILLAILVAAGILLSACGAFNPSSEAENSTDVQATSQLIGEWSGVGVITTAPFTIESEPWIIEWSHVPAVLKGETIGTLQILVHNMKNPDVPVAVVANSAAKESGTSYMRETGTFYLMINASNTRWAVKVRLPEEESGE